MNKEFENEYILMRSILNVVSDESGIPSSKIASNVRDRNLVDARRVVSVILRDSHQIVYNKIGNLLGLEHASIIHYVRGHDNLYKYDRDYRLLFDNCIKRISKGMDIVNEEIDYNKKEPELSFMLLRRENITLREKLVSIANILNFKDNDKKRSTKEICV